MYKKRHRLYRALNYVQFQGSARGLGPYAPWIQKGFCVYAGHFLFVCHIVQYQFPKTILCGQCCMLGVKDNPIFTDLTA
jgi:hypothetical protein